LAEFLTFRLAASCSRRAMRSLIGSPPARQ
jgi:hypothetical protein